MSTPIARLAGNDIGSLSSGLQLQTTMSLISRLLNAFFMPLLGYLSDSLAFSSLDTSAFIIFSFLSTLIITNIFFIKGYIYSLYRSICLSILKKGSVFGFVSFYKKYDLDFENSTRFKLFTKLRVITVIAFFPLYISWPLIFILLGLFPQNRGLVLGLSTLINGANTLTLVLLVDPYLLRIAQHKRLANLLFKDQIQLRVVASIIALFFMIFVKLLV